MGSKQGQKTPIRNAYWACQLAGWSALLLFQFSVLAILGDNRNAALTLTKSQHSRLYLAVFLICVSGFVLSHLLYLVMRRGQWMQMPLRRAWPRLVAAIAVAGQVLNVVNVVLSVYLVQNAELKRDVRFAPLLVSWLVYVFLFAVWTTIYLAVHEFRSRRIAEVNALRLELVAQEAQMRGLRAQINPHFLFNCLNGLREMIVENPERAQSMVTQLSGLLRYSLQSDNEQVLLDDEIRAVKDYLALEAIRFEERLTVRWEIAPEAVKVAVPPMLLQTLVENALKHGISRRPEGGEIAIRALVREDLLQLEVINSGEIAERPSENGIGLKNARSLLQLLYGDQAKIVLENAPGGHTRVVGTIPAGRKEAASESAAGGR
jgi:two-component system, LytTR family, sensor histidine kinase AlgZ